MDFALTANQESIRDAVRKICTRFDDAYWLEKDRTGGFPAELPQAPWRMPAGSASAFPKSTAVPGSASPRPHS